MKVYIIFNTPKYDKWLQEQPIKSRVQIHARLLHIQDNGHFGDHKDVDDV